MDQFDVPQESRVRYLQRRLTELTALEAISQSKDEFFSQAKKMGHQMKGNAASFGFDVLAGPANEMEQASILRSADKVQQCRLQIQALVQELLTQFS